MKLIRLVICGLLSTLAVSCAEDQPPAASSDNVLSAPAASPSKNSSSAAAITAAPAIDAPPKDARYTIYCLGVTGPDHTARANQVKILWQQATQRKEWYVVHQDDQSNVYFGYYPSRDNPRAIADRKMIQSLKDSIGDQPFEAAMLMALDAPDPTAPPQWNLVNAKGSWTLEIAVYKGRDRKAAAVDSVRQARDQGVEAYYYHGPSASSVCIGTWPEDAVTQNATAGAALQNPDPNQSVMVVPDELAKQMPDSMTDATGVQTKVVHNDAQVVDPTLVAMMQKYPTHSLNGYEDMIPGKKQARPSVVVPIPHAADAAAVPMTSQRPSVDLLGGDSGGDSSSGRLKSMGQ